MSEYSRGKSALKRGLARAYFIEPKSQGLTRRRRYFNLNMSQNFN